MRELLELSPGLAAAARGSQPSPTPVQCGALLPATATGLTESKELHSSLVLPDSASTSQSQQNSEAATLPAATRNGEQLRTSVGKDEAACAPLPAAQETVQSVESEGKHIYTDAANQPGGTRKPGGKQRRVRGHVEQPESDSLQAVSLPAPLQAKTPPVDAPAADQPGTGSPQAKPCTRDLTTAEPHLSSPVQAGLPSPLDVCQQADATVAHDPDAAAAKPVKSSAAPAVAKKKRGRPAKKGRQQAAVHRHSKRRAAASPEPAADVSEQQAAEVFFTKLTNAERKPAANASKEQADPKQPAVVYRRGKRKAEVALKPTFELSEQHVDQDQNQQQQHSGPGHLNMAQQMPVHEQRKPDDHQVPMQKHKRHPVLRPVHAVALPEPDASAEEVEQPPKQAIADPQTQPDPQRQPEQHEQQAQHEHSAQHEQQAQHEHSAQHEQQAQHEHSAQHAQHAQHAQQAQHRQQPQPGHQAQHGQLVHPPRLSLVQPVADPPSEPAQSKQPLPPRASPSAVSGKSAAATAPVATAPSHRIAAEPAAYAATKLSANDSIQQADRSMSLVSSGLEKAKVDQMKRVCRRLRADTCSVVNDCATHVVFKVRFLAFKASTSALLLLIALGTCAVISHHCVM